jgi:predicted RNA-binding Zn-ribbon protein involved in translation (DUF1610 family)
MDAAFAEIDGSESSALRVSAIVARQMGNGADVTDRKQKLREETERLVQEALQRKGMTIEKLKTRIDYVCGKCGFRGHILAAPNSSRVPFTCKECGHSQTTL